ncbi:MAG: orotate phosphoribosyltransferase [candidate division KSB1 bacterium]|nr:orotate phosphoribosyltransferase [candidate division KSB1 bacterium]
MERDKVLNIFQETGALLRGHFLLTSGLHSPQYFQCARVLQFPRYTEQLCREIADHFRAQKVEVVVAPAIGGIIVAQEVARLMDARAIFAEREHGVMTLRRGFELNKAEKTLVVEDVITTGGSTQEVINLVHQAGANLVGVGVLVDRSGGKVTFGVEKFSVLQLEVITYQPDACPLCAQALPLVKPGSRELPSI